MPKISEYLAQLLKDKANLVRNLKNKGVSATEDETFTTLIPKVLDIQSGGGQPTITKGLVINECDSEGYVTDAEIVGMTSIPDYYLYNTINSNNYLSRIGDNLKLPEELTSIGANSFYQCTNLSITSLPSNVTSIGKNAFQGCYNLALTSLPDGITAINDYTFAQCSKITISSLPDNIKSIGTYGFGMCSNLAINKLPSKLTSISGNAFFQCSKITISSIPRGVNSIMSNAFASCTSIEKIEILSPNISSIAGSVFAGCTNLKEVVFNAVNPPSFGTNVFNNTPIKNGTGYIYVPDESIGKYQNATNLTVYASQIKGKSEMPIG